MLPNPMMVRSKASIYGVDGSGRDTYINFDNGGNYKMPGAQGYGKYQLGRFPQQLRKLKKYARIEGRPFHYIGDGSGRDYYVINNEGGLTQRGTVKKTNFLLTLRSPTMRKETKRRDLMGLSNDSCKSRNSGSSSNSTSLSFYQVHQSRRLSEPRPYGDPYQNMRKTFRSSIGFNKS